MRNGIAMSTKGGPGSNQHSKKPPIGHAPTVSFNPAVASAAKQVATADPMGSGPSPQQSARRAARRGLEGARDRLGGKATAEDVLAALYAIDDADELLVAAAKHTGQGNPGPPPRASGGREGAAELVDRAVGALNGKKGLTGQEKAERLAVARSCLAGARERLAWLV